MTKEEWDACTDPTLMLEFIRTEGRFDERKVRLFVAVVCRRAWHLSHDARGHNAVLVAERYADGAATGGELLAAAHAANEARYRDGGIRDSHLHLAAYAPHTTNAFLEPPPHARPGYGGYAPEAFSNPEDFACLASIDAAQAVASEAAKGAADENWRRQYETALELEYIGQASLLRDILGPLPFRTPHLDPGWRTPLVLSLAQAAYEERVTPDPSRPGWLVLDPVQLAILADALEEVGCGEQEILEHLRGQAEHVRGCFALDLILGKK